MENNALISVIVSIYNVEAYLRQCLDSILNQTYKSLEIILIDDGSPDNCGAICDEYARTDPRIVVIHKMNGGLSAGWNDGFAAAKGEWIAFIDPDDWVEPNFISTLAVATASNSPDVILGNSTIVEKTETTELQVSFPEPVYYADGSGKEELMEAIVANVKRKEGASWVPAVWNKLYRREFLKSEHILFKPEIAAGMSNDTVFNLEVFKEANNVSIIECCGYHYRLQNTGSTLKFRPDRPEKMILTLDEIHSIIDDCNSAILDQLFVCRVINAIYSNLVTTYFHPENKETYSEISRKIGQMKQMPYYHAPIHSKRNKFMTTKQKILKLLLSLPWIWPLKVLVSVRDSAAKRMPVGGGTL